jgi:hypothetical protein
MIHVIEYKAEDNDSSGKYYMLVYNRHFQAIHTGFS